MFTQRAQYRKMWWLWKLKNTIQGYKWSTTFKNCNHCIVHLSLYIVLHINCTSVFKITLKKNAMLILKIIKSWCVGLPWWLSDKESACQYKRHQFDPCLGKIPHATEQLCATHHRACAGEPGSRNYWAHMPQLLKSRCPKACALPQEKLSQWEAFTTTRE